MGVKESIHILMVEDEIAHAEIIRRNLESCSCPKDLIHLSDGQQALDYIRREGEYVLDEGVGRPDLILLDLRLPRLDGLEVLRQIKEDPKFCSIPVVILTTSAAPEDIQKAYEYKVNSYLTKSVDFEKFTDQIHLMCRYWVCYNHYAGNVEP